jgi:hypothetical protein
MALLSKYDNTFLASKKTISKMIYKIYIGCTVYTQSDAKVTTHIPGCKSYINVEGGHFEYLQ